MHIPGVFTATDSRDNTNESQIDMHGFGEAVANDQLNDETQRSLRQ
jgi:hypothetical protein